MLHYDVSIKRLFKQSLTRHLKLIMQLMAAIENGRGERSTKSVDRVHDLRTETRRADVGLRVFRDWLPNHAVDRMRRKLSDLRAGAGQVRDLDVLIDSLKDSHQRLPSAARKWLRKQAMVSRSGAIRSLQRQCRHASEAGFKGRVDSLMARYAWRGSTLEPDGDEFARDAVRRRSEKLFSMAESLKFDDKQMHKTRIRARQLRYTFEGLVDALEPRLIHHARKVLTEIQEELGQANDELFVLDFIKSAVTECDHEMIAAELQQTIQALQIQTADQLSAAVHGALSRIERLQELLASHELMPV